MSSHSNPQQRPEHSAAPVDVSRTKAGFSRRVWLSTAVGGAAIALIGERWWRSTNTGVIAAAATPITVYASPTCGCCHKWVGHLERTNFHPTVESLIDVTPVKRRLGVPDPLVSCHTATAGGYIIEGHVPADLILKMLAERPAIAGLSVPGMPNGAPGMEGEGKDRYEVLAFIKGGGTWTYAVR